MLFRILFGIDTAAALVVLGFFVVGIDDGTVSSLNIQMWLGMLGGIVLVLAGGLIAKAKGQRALASCSPWLFSSRAGIERATYPRKCLESFRPCA
jgi:hypothetical protein